MHILIVGNVLKDVYLSLDSRTEHFETDGGGVKWLDLSFNASHHHYFRRTSSFGGAAVSLEVLNKLGINAAINCSDFSFDDTGVSKSSPADAYRYILTAGDSVSYLTPTLFQHTDFIAPDVTPDYIYVDRSANLDKLSAEKLCSYLDAHPGVGLVLHLKNSINPHKNSLLRYANLIFSENPAIPELSTIDFNKIIYLAEDAFTYKNITEPVAVSRVDTLTHLSMFCVAATTILGGFLLGRTVEDSLRLARAQVENATLDSCLTLRELDGLTAISSDNPELLAAAYMSSARGIPASLVLTPPKSTKNFRKFYQSGFRFAILETTYASRDNSALLRQISAVIAAGLVPIVSVNAAAGNYSITTAASYAGQFLSTFISDCMNAGISPSSLILNLSFVAESPAYPVQSSASDIAAATSEVIRRHLPAGLAGVTFAATGTQKATSIINEMKRSGSFDFPISLPPEFLQA